MSPRQAFCSAALLAVLLGCAGQTAPEPTLEASHHEVSISAADHRVDISIGGEPFTSFHYEQRWDKPFLHPLTTASGLEVSRAHPVRTIPGEHTDHDWHRGLIWGHGIINGVDFWREQGRDKTGMVVLRNDPSIAGDTITAEMELRPPDSEPIASAVEQFRFSGADGLRIIDATITVTADQGRDVTFGDTEDGGFGVRLAEPFRQEMGAMLRNSEGLEGTENIWGRSAEWVDYSASVDGKPVGVAIFDHPDNLRHPTGWHARGYSLNAANPFAARDFSGDPAADGSYTIEQGESLRLRYRVVIHEGPTDIPALYADYRGMTP